jgi:hypothetical protein
LEQLFEAQSEGCVQILPPPRILQVWAPLPSQHSLFGPQQSESAPQAPLTMLQHSMTPLLLLHWSTLGPQQSPAPLQVVLEDGATQQMSLGEQFEPVQPSDRPEQHPATANAGCCAGAQSQSLSLPDGQESERHWPGLVQVVVDSFGM